MNPLVRIAILATAFSSVATSVALGQRSRGTMGAPAVTPPRPTVRPVPPPPSTRGMMYVPRQSGPTAPRTGDLPRMVTEPRRPISGYGYTFGSGSRYDDPSRGDRGGRYDRNNGYPRTGYYYERGDRGVRYSRPPYTTGYNPYVPASRRMLVCGFGCVRFGGGLRAARVFATFSIGYPFFVPVVVPYIYDGTYVRYGDASADAYVPEPQPEAARGASKLIVVGGGSAGGGDALTVETVGDSVRLSWLNAGRAAREVRLFVSDSAKRELAARSASPSSPTATFEIATLSAPVAFAGVSVTFTDGVTSTTMVPYRGGTAAGQRR